MDYNNDGLLDLILGDYYGKLHLYTRLPNGSLTKEPALCYSDRGTKYEIDSGYFGTPQFTDWNEDGYLDLAVSGYNTGKNSGVLYIYINAGDHSDSPVFDVADMLKVPKSIKKWRSGLKVFDLNMDGAKDLVVATVAYGVQFYENIGTNSNPVFQGSVNLQTTDGVDINPYSSLREEIFDWNDDGIPDLILGVRGDYKGNKAPIYVYLGASVSIGDEENTEILNQHLEIQLLQNPVTNFLIPVDLISSTATQAVASIFDINGRLQSTVQLDLNAGTNQVILDASDIPPGICLVRVTSDSATASARVVLGY